MIPVVSLVGYSNSGKTMVMVGLIRILKARGYRVGVVKHAAHGYTIDPPGTDTWHYAEAGADQVVIAGPKSCTLHEFYPGEKTLAQIMERIQGVDIILVEGYKQQPGPKIEIYRQNYSPDRIPPNGGQLLAIVSDIALADLVPLFKFDELDQLADFVIQRIILN